MEAGAEQLNEGSRARPASPLQGLNSLRGLTGGGVDTRPATSTASWLTQDLRRLLLPGREKKVQDRLYGIRSLKRWVALRAMTREVVHNRCNSEVETGKYPTRRPLASPRGAEGYLTL